IGAPATTSDIRVQFLQGHAIRIEKVEERLIERLGDAEQSRQPALGRTGAALQFVQLLAGDSALRDQLIEREPATLAPVPGEAAAVSGLVVLRSPRLGDEP